MKALIVGPGKMGRAIEAVLVQRGHGVRARVGRRDDLEALEPDVVEAKDAPEALRRLHRELFEKEAA